MKTQSTPTLAAVDQPRIVSRLSREANRLGLKITNYEGFSRGGWGTGDGTPAPCGMWVFSVEASDPSKTTDHEPANITAENIEGALTSMREWAEYLFG